MTTEILKNFIFTSESVAEGHPDKLCDCISDAIVDAYLAQDPYSRTAVETVATTDYVGIIGEVRSSGTLSHDQIKDIARATIKKIGYDQDGFSWKTVNIDCRLHAQSADIAVGVDAAGNKDEGAGDQGIMFGFACTETPELMPAPIHYSHAILKALADDRHAGVLSMLGPDAKSQVTLEYVNGKPVRARSIVVSTQHNDGLSQSDVKEIVRPYVHKILPEGWMCDEAEFYVNPTGRFVIGGPVGDSGLTGRKIIVDTYGGAAPHGGGAFSGKDPTKVDRSAAYVARYIAKNIVAAGYAEKCLIQLSYAIGVAHPISVYVNTLETGNVSETKLADAIGKVIDLSPRGIRTHLQLNKPIYARTASYGHFGRAPDADGGFSWEKTDLVEALRKEIG
ncbi:MAG: methionine adenosyltransferase [Alphaproteobacteria bacterium RIFCSPHIGHO2_12_FULL_45_9]|nr:MAG: methionine adenosyltransferase [Alphaproteobacteria bacterium RIFCSPHIGHO2_02_FULL_46_13]OFW98223.1 MAG: methionine adenosyltransferase [Alphaproteobacteria bacterium RIFCSPHIGHO2_12_FULL_45_9]